ncbi:MAG: asparagine synthase (glutamine-hydrolyzing) [Parcubacteria group bacterium]
MCGINGFTFKNSAGADKIIERMNKSLVHRGPDDCGIFMSDFAVIGMRRLSVIDLSSGHQPIFNEDKTVAVVFNGEIYNYLEIKNELERKGHVFITKSDTEVLVHLYEEEGESMVKKLNGMFAFAIMDEKKRQIFFARDHFGVKPLYYHLTDGGQIVFSSELDGLVQYDGIKRKINRSALLSYLMRGYVIDPLTMFDGIFQLPPAHTMLWSETQGLTIKSYWSYQIAPDFNLTEQKAVERLQYLLNDSIKKQMISDVPIGAFLSGGIDSSTVAAFAALNSNRPLKTFTVKFSDKKYDESALAKLVSNHIGSEHHEIFIPEASFDISMLDTIVTHFGQPFGDTSCVPTYLLSKRVKEFVTVCLSGDGGDELFAGYDHVKWLENIIRIKSSSPERLRNYCFKILEWTRSIPMFYNSSSLRKIRKALELSLFDKPDIFFHLLNLFKISELNALIDVDILASHFDRAVDSTIGSLNRRNENVDVVDSALITLIETSLPGDMLTKVDRMSMASSLEVRVPILDHRIGELSGMIPYDLKVKNGVRKNVLRKAGQKYLPAEIYLHRKMGFALPLFKWFNSDFWNLSEFYLSKEYKSPMKSIFRAERLETILTQARNAMKREGDISHYGAATRIWLIVVLFRWADHYKVEI